MDNDQYDSLLQAYSQIRYDFDVNALNLREVQQIKNLAKEKRVDFGIAPLGPQIFRYIAEKEGNIFFEGQRFDNPELDALIYMPTATNDNVFIILNMNQSLLNQIFATAHEYYHYLKDLQYLKSNPHVCSLSYLKKKDEQKASRFAAEFLLPDEALKANVNVWLSVIKKKEFKDADFVEVAYLGYALTINYGLPLKAVLYRLQEENFINDISAYLTNYEFIKKSLVNAETRLQKQAKELMDSENPYISEFMYDIAHTAFRNGYVSLDRLEEDLEILQLDKNVVLKDIIDDNREEEELSEEFRESLYKQIMGQE